MPPSRASSRVRVLLPLPLSEAYEYGLPTGMEMPLGGFVKVPFGPRVITGVVWGTGTGAISAERLRDVLTLLDTPPMPKALRELIDWVAAYTLSPPGAVLRMAMSVPEALSPAPERIVFVRGENTPNRLTPARLRVLGRIDDGPPRTRGELAREAGVSPGVISGLVEAGALRALTRPSEPAPEAPDWRRAGPKLSAAQAEAAVTLGTQVGRHRFCVTLLDGVTGAGKTEVYFEAIGGALSAGKQVLVLVPEIALGTQWLSRFTARFGAAPEQWHSDLTRAHRRRVWRAVAKGAARVVVGARSALFLPFASLGLIVVDEEHDGSFKQEDGVIYHARDMAVVRARLEDVPIVLASATPSLETIVNVTRGRYQTVRLPARHGGAPLPRIEALDMRRHPPERGRWLSPVLSDSLAQTVASGEQGLFFLNRRGYAPLTLCRACGHRMGCPTCSAWLVEHRRIGFLLCHHCGYRAALPDTCPSCGASDKFAACGPGIERLAEEIGSTYPDLRFEVMASDTLAGPTAVAELFDRFGKREIDLLIGTQIIAKGHHFPWLTLVGVIDADLGLAGGDLRAAERTYQLLHQVAGRAGRKDKPGRVVLQTFMPEHPVMQALVGADRDRFLANESSERKTLGLPPFGRLAALIITGPVEPSVAAAAQDLRRGAPHAENISVIGPAPAPLHILRGRYRYRLLVKAGRGAPLQKYLRRWLGSVKVRAPTRVQVDIDPYNFF